MLWGVAKAHEGDRQEVRFASGRGGGGGGAGGGWLI